ncbi:MAG: SDR family NAD(P)-dependent oxidoreductase [Pseudomonadota bacterium]
MHVVITGANRGIGASLAQMYRGRGHDVTGTSRSGEGPTLDVTSTRSQRAFATTIAAPIDLLVCNAGVYVDNRQALDDGYPENMWADTFAANVTGVFLTVQSLLPQLRAAAGAKVAIISSQMGSSTHASGRSLIYRASKAAVLNLGINLSKALRPEQIAVGIYHPGWVRTDMGGAHADISMEESASGLVARFDALNLGNTGCFETWDGRPHPL